LRESGVQTLMKSITTLGFMFVSQLTVSGPHNVGKKYHLIDGAHRWAAIEKLSLSQDSTISQKFKNYIFKCHVLPPLERKQEMSLAFG
jgi:hypothetical protein